MELRHLRQFVALCDMGNVHRAAERLNISQPPLSASIRKLEVELGAQLFERHSRGVSPTEVARAGLAVAREAIRAADNFARLVKEMAAGTRGSVRLGFVASAAHELLPVLLTSLRAAHPGILMRLTEATSGEITRALEDHELDAGLIRVPTPLGPKICAELLVKERLVLLAPKSSQWAGREQIELELLRDENFVGYDSVRAPTFSHLVDVACFASGFKPNITESAANIHTIAALVEGGLGLAMVPSDVGREAYARLVTIPFTAAGQHINVGLALATRVGEEGKMVATLRKKSLELFQQDPHDIADGWLGIG